VVSFATMIYAVQWFDCVQASAVIATTTHWATSLAVLVESLIEGPPISFLWSCSKLVWGSFVGCRCSKVLELHRVLILSSTAQAYRNVGP
jgi:hypothetical protein